MPAPRRLKKIVKAAVAAGWTYDTTAANHPRLSPPAGLRWVQAKDGSNVNGVVGFKPEAQGDLVPPVTFSLTPSDVRGDRNGVAALRRAGVAV